MGEDELISTQNLSKRYDGTPALDGVTLEVPPGSIGLLGENGAGKTTLIKLLLGLLRPTSGSAQVLGLDVARLGLELRRLLGYMPEEDCLPPDLSGLDLVVRMGRLSGLPKEAALQRAYDVLHLVGLGEERYRPIGGYSVGMRQRVKLAQALVHDPKLVLLDEPTSGLDPQGREEMLELIRDIRKRMGISLLLSSHLLPDVERICEYVIILREGRVMAQGPLEELLGDLSAGWLVRVVGDQDKFIEGLRAEGLKVERLSTQILVKHEREDICDLILQQAVSSGVQLRRLERQTRSLEDFFLALHR
jgi:ABC-2 type transport system ATP-binding protein